jgi:hypothetical protein
LRRFIKNLNQYLKLRKAITLKINITKPSWGRTLSKMTMVLLSKITLNIAFLLGCLSTFAQHHPFIPDSTINRVLKLENYKSLEKFAVISREIKFVHGLRETAVAVFLNRDRSEYLLAYHYEGDSKNTYACFEIGLTKNFKIPKMRCN